MCCKNGLRVFILFFFVFNIFGFGCIFVWVMLWGEDFVNIVFGFIVGMVVCLFVVFGIVYY